jgi:hypothetical protein
MSINKNSGTLDKFGNITFAPNVVRRTVVGKDGKERKVTIVNPTAVTRRALGLADVVDERPPSKEGYTIVPVSYKWANDEHTMIERIYEYKPIVHSVADYDAAMEDYLRSVREERGYTTREPSDYLYSQVPRWAQDAKDWIAFRDAVMAYALELINAVDAGADAPTMEEFMAGMPKVKWNFEEI